MSDFNLLTTACMMAVLSTVILSSVFPSISKQVVGSWNTAYGTTNGAQSDGVFTPVTTRTIANSSMIKQITHVIDTEGINPTRVLDWSQDGRHVLFQFNDYNKIASWGPADPPYSLALIDLKNGNEIQKLDLEFRSAPTEDYPEGYLLTIYQAKFSSSGDSIFLLIGGNDPENPHQAEDIYRYDLRTGVIHQTTNSTNVARFDIEKKANDTLAYMTYDDIFHFYPQDNPQLGSKLRNLMMTNNVQPIIDQFAVSPEGKQFAFPTSDGIKYMNLQSGDVRTIIPRTCISSVAFSPNAEFLIYSPHSERNCENGEDYVLRIVSIEGNNESGELVYMDNWGTLDTVISPDGTYLATNAQGSDERIYSQGDENDISPRIVTIQLARAVPEFGNMMITIFSVLVLATSIIMTISKKFNFHIPI